MLKVIVFLKNRSSPKLQVSSRLCQVFLQDFPWILLHFFARYHHKSSNACWREASPQRDAPTIMFHHGDGGFLMILMPNVKFRLVAKASILVSSVYRTFFQLASESPTCQAKAVASLLLKLVSSHWFLSGLPFSLLSCTATFFMTVLQI